MKKLSMLLVLCAAILPLGAIQTYSANQVKNVSAPHGFSIAQDETLTTDSIKEKSDASGDVTVSQDALNAINKTGSAGIIYNLPITVNGGSYNIVVAKAGSNVATNGTTAIYAANIVANANIDINNAITLASVKAYDLVNGYTITDQVSVVDNGNTITFSVNGLSKQITVSNRGGAKEIPTGDANGQPDTNQPDTPQDTPQQPEGVTLVASDLKITPEVAKKINDVSALVNMMAAKGTNVDGTPLSVEASTADFAAIQAGTEGDYIINFTAQTAKGETVSTTATLTIKVFALEEQQGQVAFINANNKLLTTTGTTEKVKSLDDLKTVMGVTATVSGKDALAQVTVTATKEAELLKGTPGTYEVTFEIKGKDQYTSAKTTVILTVVSDDTPITPDGKGYLSATNFLITTDEAKKITSSKDYKTIHSATGSYDGSNAFITATVADNSKIVNGYQGIFDVKFTLDGDGDTTTKDDQVSVIKKLTVVYDTKGGDVDAPVDMFPELPSPYARINTVFNYTNYSREQRIEGKFAVVMAPRGNGEYSFTVQEFLDLTYAQFMSYTKHIVIGQNGEYINNFVVDDGQGTPPTQLTDEQIEQFKEGMVNIEGYSLSLDVALNETIFKQLQEALKVASQEVQANQKPHTYINSFLTKPVQEGTTVYVNGINFFDGVSLTYLLAEKVSVIVADPGSNKLQPELNKYYPPAQDMMNGIIVPLDAPAKFGGQAETVVLRKQLNDTSVANVSALTNTSVLEKGQLVAPEGITLNPATVPAYGPVQANYSYKDITFNNTLYVYPDNAIVNPTQDGYVAGSDNMVTQAELNNVKTADQFFALIQASSATAKKQFANPTVTCDNIADLKAGKVGVYKLTLENADKSAKTEVMFTVRPNNSVATPDNKGYVGAVGSFITEEQAKQITKQDFLAGLNNASAVYNGATIAPTVEIAPESFAKIQAGTKGIYKVTYKIDMNGQTATKTVNLAVAPKGSKLTGDGLGFIYAQDATIKSSQAQALVDPNELIAIHDAFAFYGENEEAPIVVKTDFAAIQASRGGEYQVTFLLDGGNNPMTRAGELQPNQAEISVVLTVVDDITDPKPAEPTPVVAQPAPQIPTGVKNAAIGLGLVVAIAAVGLVLIKRNRK